MQNSDANGDPALLGPDLLARIFSLLPPQSLLAAACVSQNWQKIVGERGERLWQEHAEAAWEEKVYVAPAQEPGLTWKQRYLAAAADASRSVITADELCAFRWTFRFKQAAGEFWLGLDPYWVGNTPMQRLFHPDGSLTAPAGDHLWGPHECRWRFCKTRQGVRGHFVKVNHWPSLHVSRLPDGGFQMENEWVVYRAVLRPSGPYCRGIAVGQARHLE